jgi:hypothetical protein
MIGSDLVDRYLADLAAAAAGLPADRRAELLEDVREHIASALDGAAPDDKVAVRNVLERLGSPADIVAAEWAAEGVVKPVVAVAGAPAPVAAKLPPPPSVVSAGPPPPPAIGPFATAPLVPSPAISMPAPAVTVMNWGLMIGIAIGLIVSVLGLYAVARGLGASAWLIVVVGGAMMVLLGAEWIRTGGRVTPRQRAPLTLESFARASVIVLVGVSLLGGLPLAAIAAVLVLALLAVGAVVRAARGGSTAATGSRFSPEAAGLAAIVLGMAVLVLTGHVTTAITLTPPLALVAVLLLLLSAVRTRRRG